MELFSKELFSEFVIKVLGEQAAKSIFRSKLESQLESTTELWSLKLPSDLRVLHLAVFDRQKLQDSEHMKAVREVIENNRVPEASIWEECIYFEALSKRNNLDDVHAFFLLNENELKSHLKILAHMLESCCRETALLFNNETIALLRTVAQNSEETKLDISVIRRVVEENAGFLGNFENRIKILEDGSRKKKNINTQARHSNLGYSLFRCYHDTGYLIGVAIDRFGRILIPSSQHVIREVENLADGKLYEIESISFAKKITQCIKIQSKTFPVNFHFGAINEKKGLSVYSFNDEGKKIKYTINEMYISDYQFGNSLGGEVSIDNVYYLTTHTNINYSLLIRSPLFDIQNRFLGIVFGINPIDSLLLVYPSEYIGQLFHED